MEYIKNSLLIYISLVVLILVIKPTFIIDKEGNLKDFGTGNNKTLMPLWLIFSLMGLLSYIIILLVN